jgi:hypothetical protein
MKRLLSSLGLIGAIALPLEAQRLTLESGIRTSNRFVIPSGILAYSEPALQTDLSAIVSTPLGTIIATYFDNRSFVNEKQLAFPRSALQRTENDYSLSFTPKARSDVSGSFTVLDIYDVGVIAEAGVNVAKTFTAKSYTVTPRVNFTKNFSAAANEGFFATGVVSVDRNVSNFTFSSSTGISYSGHYIVPKDQWSGLQSGLSVAYNEGNLTLKADYTRHNNISNNPAFASGNQLGISIRSRKIFD